MAMSSINSCRRILFVFSVASGGTDPSDGRRDGLRWWIFCWWESTLSLF